MYILVALRLVLPRAIASAIASLAVALLLAPLNVYAAKIQVGAESVNLATSTSNDFPATSTTMPFIAIGGSSTPGAVFAELGLLSYKVNALDTVNAGSSPVTYDVSGTSLALVLADYVHPAVAMRLGVGAILYSIKPTVTAAGVQAYAGQGLTNPAIKIDDYTANFVLFGFDFYLLKSVLLGVEYRYVSQSPKFTTSGTVAGTPTSSSQTTNDSQGWTALRLALEF